MLAVALAGALAAAAVQAAGDEAVIKYRQAIMKGHGAHLGAMFQIVKGGAGKSSDLTAHAHALHEVSKMIPEAFSQRTEGGKTEALVEIWDDASGFKSKASDMEKMAGAVLAAVKAGDKEKIGKALGEAGDGCKACHKEYRKKKKS
jgi:cytochrome c556